MTGFEFVWVAFLVRTIAAAGFVAGVIWLMERTSPFIGGVVLGLPFVIAPTYIFLLLNHDPTFVAGAATGGVATLGAALLFLAVIVGLLRRFNMPVSLAAGILAWLCGALLIRLLPASPAVSFTFLAACAAIAWTAMRRVALTAPVARGRSPGYELLLRGGSAGLLVGGVSTLAAQLGAQLAGIIASFPIALTVVCLFLPQRLEKAGMRAALTASALGLASHAAFFLCLILLAPVWGGWPAFLIGVAAALATALAIALLRRRQAGR